MTSNKRLSITNRNRILIRIIKELDFTMAKSKHISGHFYIKTAKGNLIKALNAGLRI